MQVKIGRHSCAVYVKPDLTFRRVWEDIRVGRSCEAQQYITARLTLKNTTTSIHLTTQPLLDRVVRVGDKLVVEIMQEASVEINTEVSRIVNFFHSDSIEVMLLAISVAGETRRRGVFNRGNLADIGITLLKTFLGLTTRMRLANITMFTWRALVLRTARVLDRILARHIGRKSY